MKLPRVPVLAIEHVYSDVLEQTIEIAVFDQGALADAVSLADLEDVEADEYKAAIVSQWPGLPSHLRGMAPGDPRVNEIFSMITLRNPVLGLVNLYERETLGATQSEKEKEEITKWFSSRGTQGMRPKVIHGKD